MTPKYRIERLKFRIRYGVIDKGLANLKFRNYMDSFHLFTQYLVIMLKSLKIERGGKTAVSNDLDILPLLVSKLLLLFKRSGKVNYVVN